MFDEERTIQNESNTNVGTKQESEPVISEPYRYKYENGEKREEPNSSSYYRSPYDTYNYNTSYNYENTASRVTAEVPVKKKKRPFVKVLKWVAGAACFGIIAGAAFIGTSYLATEVFDLPWLQKLAVNDSENSLTADGNTIITGNGTPVNITLGTASVIEGAESPAESVVVQVVEQNLAATVAVNSTILDTIESFWGTYEQEVPSSGSGFIVGKNDTELLIATNNHVVADSTKIEVTFIDDTVLEAMIKGTDAKADLAIIAVPLKDLTAETLSNIRIATLGDSEKVRLGEMAIAIGNALGYGQSVTVGYISAKDRTINVEGNEIVALQTDAAINGGNSGGPLFNTKGEVIGINSAKYQATGVEGMCFAIPISRAIPILNELMTREILADEDKGFLGVTIKDVTADISAFYGWPIGAYIYSILEDSPAEAANLQVGDIVTNVNGVRVSTANELIAAVSSYRYGTTAELTVQRFANGQYNEMTINATLGKKADFEEAVQEEAEGQIIEEENSNRRKPKQ